MSNNADHLTKWIRFYSDLSDSQYSDRMGFAKSGAAPVDGERHRLTAAALRLVLLGATVEEAVGWYRCEWRLFAIRQNQKVKDAPITQTGPYSGQSVIQYQGTDIMAGADCGEQNIRLSCA